MENPDHGHILSVSREVAASGGDGLIFHSKFPERLSGKNSVFFAITKLPVRANINSEVFMFRTRHTLEILREAMVEGMPLILGKIPLEAQIGAAAIGEANKLAEDSLRLTENNSNAIVLIQPEVRQFIFEHEYQHWLDYQSNVLRPLKEELNVIFNESSIENQTSEKLVEALVYYVLEMRGHAVQAKRSRDDKAALRPTLDRAGNFISNNPSNHSRLMRIYDFEESHAYSLFNSTYMPYIMQIFNFIGPSLKESFIRAASNYDFSDMEGNILSMREYR